MTESVLPQAFYRYIVASLYRQIEFLRIAVDAGEEDVFRQLLRLITTSGDIRRMLMQYDDRLREMGLRIIEEDKFSDPDLETRRADRGELSGENFLDDIELDPSDLAMAEALILLGQSSGALPQELDHWDLTRTYSRQAAQEAYAAHRTGECNVESSEGFTLRIIELIEAQEGRSKAAAQALAQ